ncbi:MAG: hypothetical protein PF961_12605, partial [Planctomycetota bacterium]|nr:hypothetical protein [Planctomycetota bacterium]
MILRRVSMVMAVCGLVAALGAADNLVRNPEFADAVNKSAPGWVIADWVRVGFIIEHGDTFARVENPKITGTHYIEQTVALPADAKAIAIGCDFRVHELTRGNESWQVPRVTVDFINADGKRVASRGPVPQQTTLGGWSRSEVQRAVPAGAVSVRLQPGMWFCAGRVDIRAVSVRVVDGTQQGESRVQAPVQHHEIPQPPTLTWPEAQAVAVPAVVDAWRQAKTEAEGPHRSRMSLDGFWAFAPAPGDGAAPSDAAGYGLMLVPGSWVPPDVWSWRKPAGWERRFGNPFVMRPGAGPDWKDFDPYDCARAWYARLVDVPAQWQGQRVLLRVDRVSTEARLFINGTPVAQTLGPQTSEVEVTDLLRFDASNTIHLLVVASDSGGSELLLMGTDAGKRVATKLATRGLIGSITLVSQPQRSVLALGLRIEPRVNERVLGVAVPVQAAYEATELKLALTVRDNGHDAIILEQAFDSVVAEAGVVQVQVPWPDVHLWTPDDPHLYQLALSVQAPDGAVDSQTRRFGFRDVAIDGRDVLLNGVPFKIHPAPSHHVSSHGLMMGSGIPITRAVIRNHFRTMRSLGFNLQEYWPRDPLARGVAMPMDLWAEVADEEGFLLTGPMPHLADRLDEWRLDRAA